jgi:hypothetical protein
VALDFVDIDHVVLRVGSLRESGETYRRLGFTLTPVRAQVPLDSWVNAGDAQPTTATRATINQRQVLFRPHPDRYDVANFIALIAVEDQLGTPPGVTQMLSYLADTEGPRTMVLKTDDVVRARKSLEADGIVTFDPVRFDTGWQDDERDVFVPISSSAALPIHGQVPFMFDPFQTWTPGSYTYAPWVEHRNGAQRITMVNGITRDVERDAKLMADRVFGGEVSWESRDIAILRRRDVALRIVSPAGFSMIYPGQTFSRERILPHLFGLTIGVPTTAALQRVLDEGSIEYGWGRDGLVVPRHQAHNTLLEFVPLTPSK